MAQGGGNDSAVLPGILNSLPGWIGERLAS